MRTLIGQFQNSKLQIIIRDETYSYPAELQRRADQHWEKLINDKGNVWNSTIYRLHDLRTGPPVELEIGYTDYKNTAATRLLIDDIARLSPSNRPNGMYVSGLIKTSDAKYVVAQKSPHSIQKNSINLIGGALNKDEVIITSADDMSNHVLTEIHEELNIKPQHMKIPSGHGIYETPSMRIAVCYDVECDLSSNEILDMAVFNFEHQALHFFTRDEFPRFQSKHSASVNPLISHIFS